MSANSKQDLKRSISQVYLTLLLLASVLGTCTNAAAADPGAVPRSSRSTVPPTIQYDAGPPEARMAGTVRDPSGAAIAGMRVSFHPGEHLGAYSPAETTTDQNGRYELRLQRAPQSGMWWGAANPANYLMVRDLSRNLAVLREFNAVPSNLDLTLQPGISLSGTVLDTNHVPITNAFVELHLLSGGFLIPFPSESTPTVVDSKGRFTFVTMPAGQVYGFSQDVCANGYVPGSAMLDTRTVATNHYEFPTIILPQGHVYSSKR